MAQPRQFNLTLRQCTRMRLKANSGARKSRSLELDCPSPPPAPPPQGRKPLPVAHSPVLRPASPPQIPQPQGGTPSPRAPLSPGGTADSSPIQPQRKKMPLPGAGMSAPPPPEIPRPAAVSPGESPPSAPLLPAPPCTATPHTASCAWLLQTADIPSGTTRLVCCHNLWPTEDVLFCPNDALPAFVTGIPALSSGPELWIAVHNHRPWASPASLRAEYQRPQGGNPR